MSTPTEPHLEQHTKEHPQRYTVPRTTIGQSIRGWSVILFVMGTLTLVGTAGWLIPLVVTAVFVLH